jgi:hypothetical protein
MMPTLIIGALAMHQQQLNGLFSRMEVARAALPSYPEMLDFDLDENKLAEVQEIEEYFAHFGVRI